MEVKIVPSILPILRVPLRFLFACSITVFLKYSRNVDVWEALKKRRIRINRPIPV
jgi:hypothetical protein